MNPKNQTLTMYNFTGILLIVREAIFIAAFFILGASINWPQSLGLPAAEAFPLITENSSAVFSGYYFYLLSSLLILPMILAVLTLLKSEDSFLNLLLNIAGGFVIASVVMRALGILRWLFAMPILAAAYLDTNASPAVREFAALNFEMLNAYAGKAGEHLGVQLLTTLFMAVIGLAMLRSSRIPSWFGWWALMAAVLALPYEDLLGLDLGGMLLTISGVTTSLWTIALGIYLLVRARALSKTSVNSDRERQVADLTSMVN